MRTALVTIEIPPFRERSPWMWGLENLSADRSVELVGISDREQFGQGEFEAGTAHLLNVFADPETDWSRRELTEFSVKAYVYLSKIHRRDAFDRFVVADAGGIEPLLVANLSVMAPVWIVEPAQPNPVLDNRGTDLLELAQRRFPRQSLPGLDEDEWPPDVEAVRGLFDELIR